MKIKGGVLLIVNFFGIVISYPSPLCPSKCYCSIQYATCTNISLSSLPNGIDSDIPSVDLSFNKFREFPKDWTIFNNLIYLNLSHNNIEKIDANIYGLNELRTLDLSHNWFSTWNYIDFGYFKNMKLAFLDLSFNNLRALPKETRRLAIDSLEILRLSNCSIRQLNKNALTYLPKILELHVSRNPITVLNSSLSSNTLKFLDLSECNLKMIGVSVFENLKALQTLYLYMNINLKNFNSNSDSLLLLDLSYCNLESIPTGRLPEMTSANLASNHFRIILKNSFQNLTNYKLEKLVLNDNALFNIEMGAFSSLTNLKTIDLSINTLNTLHPDLFIENKFLTDVNLSRNYFQRMPTFKSDVITTLDISKCEITRLDRTCLVEMPLLRDLRLSKNMITSLPDFLEANSLQILDVSLCRINNINNRTFAKMPSLRVLNLSGNRLTTTSPNNFDQIYTLDISDNPWRCDCETIKPLYDWMVMTGKDVRSLICQSPDRYEGLPWLTACQNTWRPDLIKKDSVWWYTTGIIVTIFVILCLIIMTRRIYLLKEKRLRAQDLQRRNEEREALRRMQRMEAEHREQTDIVNAPEPRELNPPSYNEALLLPKLDASHPSLAGSLHSLASKHSLSNSNTDVRSKPRRKRRRRKSNSSEGQRASRVVVDTSTSEQEQPEPRTTLESDF